MEVSKVKTPGSDVMPVDSDLSKSQTYLLIEEMMEKNIIVKQERLETFVELLNRDLARRDNVLRILKIFKIIFTKIKAGTLSEFSLLSDTLISIIDILTMAKKDGKMFAENDKIFNICTEILVNLSGKTFLLFGTQSFPSVYKLISAFLSTGDLRCLVLVLQFLQNYIVHLSNNQKAEFVRKGMNIWFSDVIPFLFLNENHYRKLAIDVFEMILPDLLQENYFNHPLWPGIVKNVKDREKYPKLLLQLMNGDDPLWSNLWTLVIKIMGTELHTIGGSINPLLFVLQEAFKKNVEFKSQAFKCLKVLIDNFALDPELLTHNNRIKVLTTALESNNAKTEQIALLKFEIWWHLISVLEQKAKSNIPMVVIPFLEFCYGSSKNPNLKTNKVYPGEVFPSVQKLAIKSFVEICGHIQCTGCTNNSVSKLGGPILDCELMEKFHTNLIQALKIVTVYVNKHLFQTDKKLFEELIQNLKCIWKSFIKISSKLKNPHLFTTVIKNIFNLLSFFVQSHSKEPLFAEIVITLIIPAIVDKNHGYSATTLNDTYLKISNSLTPIQALVSMIIVPELYHSETMANLHFDFDRYIEVGILGGLQEFCTWMLNILKPNNHGPLIWCSLANVLSICPNPIPVDILMMIRRWPIKRKFSDNKIQSILKSWKKIIEIPDYRVLNSNGKPTQKHENSLLNFILKVSRNENAPHNIARFLLPSFIKKLSIERAGSLIIKSSLLEYEGIVKKLNADQLSHCEKIGLCYSLFDLPVIVVYCMTFDIRTPLKDVASSIMNNSIDILDSTFLMNKNNSCQNTDEIDYMNNLLEALHKIGGSGLFCKNVVPSAVKLLLTIAKNVNNSSIQDKCSDVLQYLKEIDGKYVNLGEIDLSNIEEALKILNKTKQNSLDVIPKPKISPISKGDSKKTSKLVTKTNDGFVVVKPAWKFDPKNLTEHQKESLKRRRDDIPALYEDLSQSQDENTIKSWKPPGYNSDSQGDSSKSESTVINGGNKPNGKFPVSISSLNCVPLKCSKVEDNKADGRIVLRLSRIGSPESTVVDKQTKVENEKLEQKKEPNNSESNNSSSKNSPINCSPVKNAVVIIDKTDIENMKYLSPQSTPGRKRKSILTRINDNLKNLKSIPNDKETLTPIKPDDPKEKCPIEKIVACDVEPADKSELSENVVKSTQNDETKKKTPPKRPNRIRRKPNKLLNTEVDDKKQNTKNSSNDNTSSESDSQNVTCIENVLSTKETQINLSKSSQNLEESLSPSLSTETIKPKGKRRSRLLNQLQIDTKEGHPLIALADIGQPGRISRRSMVKPENDKVTINKPTTKRKYNKKSILHDSQSDKNEPMEIESPSNNDKSIHSQETQHLSPVNSKVSEKCIENIKNNTERTVSSESLDIGPDFIESSQEDTLSLKTAISRSRESSVLNEKEVLNPITPQKENTPPSSQDIAEAETEPFISINETTPNPTQNEISSPDKVEKPENESCIQSSADADTLPFTSNNISNLEDKPNKKESDEIAHSEKTAAKSGSPEKSTWNDELLMNVSIISSPCQDDVKERTMEFLNNTIDISPIKGDSISKVSPEEKDTREDVMVSDIQSPIKADKPPLVISPDLFTNEKTSPTKEQAVAEKIIPLAPIFNFGSRTAQMLSLCMDNDNSKNGIQDKKDVQPSKTSWQENGSTEQNLKPMLEFSKSIPCSTASPVGPILKRKIEVDELTISPSSKRKRVSFHDPPVSTTVSVEKYLAPRGIKSPQIRILYGDKNEIAPHKPSRPLVAKCLMNNIAMQAKLEQEHADETSTMDGENDAPDSQLSEAFSLIVDSPRPLNIITNYLLNDRDPIYPSLLNCNDPLSEISSYLSSPLWKDEFLEEIKEKISTVGDLAKLTELEVNRLPFKTPKLETVKKVLSDYENRLRKKDKEDTLEECAIFDADDKIESKGDSILGDIKLTGVFIDDEQPTNKTETMETEEVCVVESFENNNMANASNLDLNSVQTDDNSSTSRAEESSIEPTDTKNKMKILEDLIDSNPDDVLKKMNERFTYGVILDNVPLEFLTEYVSEKIKHDKAFCSNMTAVLVKISNRNIISKSSQLKLFYNKLSKISVDLTNVMSSLEKFTDE